MPMNAAERGEAFATAPEHVQDCYILGIMMRGGMGLTLAMLEHLGGLDRELAAAALIRLRKKRHARRQGVAWWPTPAGYRAFRRLMPWTTVPDVLGYWTCEGPPGSGLVAWVRAGARLWQWGVRRGQALLASDHEDTRLAAQERAEAVLDSLSAPWAGGGR